MQTNMLILILLVAAGITLYLYWLVKALQLAKKCECKNECTCGEEKQLVR